MLFGNRFRALRMLSTCTLIFSFSLASATTNQDIVINIDIGGDFSRHVKESIEAQLRVIPGVRLISEYRRDAVNWGISGNCLISTSGGVPTSTLACALTVVSPINEQFLLSLARSEKANDARKFARNSSLYYETTIISGDTRGVGLMTRPYVDYFSKSYLQRQL